jgi:competence protein ComEA
MNQGEDSANSAKKYGWWWIALCAILVAAIISGGVVLATKHIGRGQPLEIVLSSDNASELEVYLSGAVVNEGIYPITGNASIADVLGKAGGVAQNAESTWLKIYVPSIGESPFEQHQEPSQDDRININTASAEELDTLPGIGPVKAQAIIDYRSENGPFHTVDELLDVNGIGPKTLEDIRDKVKVVD